MTHALQTEFARYVETDEGAAYIRSALFERRCIELFDRFDAGETMEAAQAAEFVGLPWPVFRQVFAEYLALVCLSMGEPPSDTVN